MKELFFLFTLLFISNSMAQDFEEISNYVENNKLFDERLIVSSRVSQSINSLDSLFNYDNYDKIRFDYTIGNNKLKLYVFKLSDLLIVTFHKQDSSFFYSDYLILNKKTNKFYLLSLSEHPNSFERSLYGFENIEFIVEVDCYLNPIHKHYLVQGEIYITSNFINYKGRWFEELGILENKVSIKSYSTKRVFGEMPIPALSSILLVFQREINYDLGYPFWYAIKFLEPFYYELPGSSMDRHHPSSYPSKTKKILNNPVKIED